MKKGAVKYIVGGCMVAFGILLVIIACAFGGWKTLLNFGGISVNWDGFHFYSENSYEYYVTGENGIMEKEDIRNLNIEVDYGKLTIKTDDIDEIRIDTKNIVTDRFKYEQDGDTLKIKYGGGFSFFTFKSNSEITITFPKNMTFEKTVIKNGAGKTDASNIISKEIVMDNGAGELNFSNITAEIGLSIDNGAGAIKMDCVKCGELEFKGGVGEIAVKDTSCTGLKVENGIGAFDFKGEVEGNAQIDNGIGEIRMTLYGSSSDYSFDVDSGIGNVRVNGNSPILNTQGKYKFEIDTGVGEVKINFEQKS